MGPKTSSSTPNSEAKAPKTMVVSSDSSNPAKVLERKPSSKITTLSENQPGRASEMQQHLFQLKEELKKAREEKSRAITELTKVKKEMQMNAIKVPVQSKNRIENLLIEMEKSKESERKMLESRISTTKQLEETKITLEESKQVIRSLQESNKKLEVSSLARSRNTENQREKIVATKEAKEEIRMLSIELNLAIEAEAMNKKAMKDLELAVTEVTAEANRVQGRLSITQSQLANTKTEAEHLKDLLRITEDKIREAEGESEHTRMEMAESVAAWTSKESDFLNSIKVSKEEMSKAMEENHRLIDSERFSREKNSTLREMLKQSKNESRTIVETLEITTKENSHLKNQIFEKGNSLRSIKHEYECLKVSEAAALGSAMELKKLLTLTMNSCSTIDSLETRPFQQPKAMSNEICDGKSMEIIPSPILMDGKEQLNFDNFYHIGLIQFRDMEKVTKQEKNRPMLRRFEHMVKRRSFHK